MRLSTELLREYLVFTETMNFTLTAKNLHMAPSTLNRHILDLEKQVGRKLFVRGQQITLTKIGRKLLSTATDILQCESQFIKYLSEANKQENDVIRFNHMIGFTGFAEFTFAAVASFSKRFPSVTVKHQELPTGHDPMSALLENLLDLGSVLVLDQNGQSFEEHNPLIGYISPPQLQRLLGIYVEKSHHLADKQSVTVGDLRNEQIIMPVNPIYRQFRHQIEQLCVQNGFCAHFDYRDAASYSDCYIQPTNRSVYLQMIDYPKTRFLPSSLIDNDDLVARALQESIYVKPTIAFRTDNINETLAALLDTISKRSNAQLCS
jgi:DNA-binding transcriptional LysR family regulator